MLFKHLSTFAGSAAHLLSQSQEKAVFSWWHSQSHLIVFSLLKVSPRRYKQLAEKKKKALKAPSKMTKHKKLGGTWLILLFFSFQCLRCYLDRPQHQWVRKQLLKLSRNAEKKLMFCKIPGSSISRDSSNDCSTGEESNTFPQCPSGKKFPKISHPQQ